MKDISLFLAEWRLYISKSVNSAFTVLEKAASDFLRPRIFTKFYAAYIGFYLLKALFRLNAPKDFIWGDLFINYSGGFIRRGIPGELFLLLEPWLDIRFLAPLVFAIIFLFYLKTAWRYINSAFDWLSSLAIFVCPAYFIFQVKDYQQFMRRDCLIELLIFTSLVQISECMAKNSRLVLAACVFSACFILSCLVHELAITFWPLPACLLGLLFYRHGKTLSWLVLMFLLFGIAALAIVQFPGSPENRELICKSWQLFYPDYMCEGGLRYIGQNLGDLWPSTHQYHLDPVSVRSFIWGIFLSILPLVWICFSYHLMKAVRELFPLRLLALLPIAATTPWLYFIFAEDWGRNIAFASINYLFFLWTIQSIVKNPAAPWLSKLQEQMRDSEKLRLLIAASLVLYGTSWTLMPWVHVGEPIVQWSGLPDFILYLFRTE